MTDTQLRDAALAELRLTTVGYRNRYWTVPPSGSHWANAIILIRQISAWNNHPSADALINLMKTTAKYNTTGVYWKAALAALALVTDAPPALGADLLAAWPAPAEPTRTIEFGDMLSVIWANPKPGTIYEGGDRTLNFTSILQSHGPLTAPTIFQNFTLVGAGLEMVGCRNLYLRNVTIRDSPVDGLKIDGGSTDCGWDGLTVERSAVQGILLGSGSEASVKRIRGLNTISRYNGGRASTLNHGLYACHVDGFLLANFLSHDNCAYAAQFYPQCRNGVVTGMTADGGLTRGGIVFGTESGEPEPTQNVRVLASIVSNAPVAAAAHVLNGAPGCSYEDSVSWQNMGGPATGVKFLNELVADPLYISNLTGDYRITAVSPAHGHVLAASAGWLLPTDLAGVPRGLTCGAYA